VGVAGLGDFEEVVRLQAGIRQWLLRTARNGRHELRGIPAPAVLPLLCAAAFGPALTEAADLGGAAAVARVGVLSSVGASALGDVLAQALERVRSAQPGGDLPRGDVQREVSRSMQEALSAGDPHADEVRSDVAIRPSARAGPGGAGPGIIILAPDRDDPGDPPAHRALGPAGAAR
jgi:hypothetical protein